ncbi:MAG: hypothetical protein HYX39_02830, partial [Bacteroidetes bacterium]|nr:hypothetical protein [Bacteroidota bacterium]
FPAGNATDVLYGNGTWGSLPVTATSWNIVGHNLVAATTGNIGLGTNSPQYKLHVVGDAFISNNLFVGGGIIVTDQLKAAEYVTTGRLTADTIKMGLGRVIDGTTKVAGDLYIDPTRTLTAGGDIMANSKLTVAGNASFNGNLKVAGLGNGTGDQELFVDANGMLKVPGTGLPNVCQPNNPAWRRGGNVISGFGNEVSIGTCNNFPFILKANNVNRMWISEIDGTIGFGTSAPSNTGGKEFKFDQGAIRLSGNNTFGGPMFVFGGATNPYGDWGIEYTDGTGAPNPGLNFWKPFASTNANNNILFLHDNNRIGIGTDNPSSRLTIDAWSDDGILILSDPGKNALDVTDKSTGSVNFRVKANGIAYAREIYVQIGGFPDYVFDAGYKLPSLVETKNYILSNHHLKNMPTADDVKTGANIGEIQKATVEKLEEAYLYIFQLEEKLNLMAEKINKLEQKQN